MRIAIANDMGLAVEVLKRVLISSREHEIAWVARDGLEAVEKCRQDRPDLILMDLVMPRLSGVEATRQIMLESPCAILVVTASVNSLARAWRGRAPRSPFVPGRRVRLCSVIV